MAMAVPKAQDEKEKGNVCYKAGEYAEAVGHYTAAILADGHDYTFPLNRAAAYLRLGKNEDAERDCTAVLSMSAGNVKALFRRGQARVALGCLDKAEEDLKRALEREPANVAVREELERVSAALLEREQKKKQREEKTKAPSGPTPPRRRVPITIVDPPASSSTHTDPPAATTARPTTAADAPDTLRAVSSRPLKHPAAPAASANSVSPAPAPTPTATGTTPEPPQARTFADARRAREQSRPSRVGGGIFRASGENTVFPTRSVTVVPAAAAVEAGTDAVAGSDSPASGARLVPVSPRAAPKTCFDFVRAWDATPDVETRWGLLLSVPPSGVPALFKTSLEPALLMSILGVFRRVLGAPGEQERVRAYMDAFGEVERFGTVVLFLSRAEKEVARGVWEALGVGKEGARESGWKSVWK